MEPNISPDLSLSMDMDGGAVSVPTIPAITAVSAPPILLYTRVRRDEPSYALKHHYEGDAGYDLTVSRTITVPRRGFAQICSNVAVALPAGTWAMITGRSSTFHQRNLIVNAGIIDNGWRGELLTVVYNPTDRDTVVRRGDRVAQLILFELVRPKPVSCKVEELPSGDRGTNGFGSTGTDTKLTIDEEEAG